MVCVSWKRTSGAGVARPVVCVSGTGWDMPWLCVGRPASPPDPGNGDSDVSMGLCSTLVAGKTKKQIRNHRNHEVVCSVVLIHVLCDTALVDISRLWLSACALPCSVFGKPAHTRISIQGKRSRGL